MSRAELAAIDLLATLREASKPMPSTIRDAVTLVDRELPNEPEAVRYETADTLFHLSRIA